MKPSRAAAALLAPALLAGTAACGDDATAGEGEGLRVVTAFYPLQYVTERLVADGGTVTSLTQPGAEPHDLELTPQDVGTVGEASLVVYLGGFQPAVDDAVDAEAGDRSLDVAEAADLDLTYTPIEEGEEEAEEAGATDPHFWLDPTRLAAVGEAVADRLAEVDPEGADAYAERAADLRSDLEALDGELAAGLESCTSRDVVTSHNAFGYLAERYGLRQVGITGLTPEDEPSPADLAAVTEFVRANGVRTIYYETLVSPEVAETVAAETGAETGVLDPLEGLSPDADGDYLEVMRANLAALQEGQPCP